ncbi:bacteriocin biosynthesis cyclodehydratase domain-containing protein [Streptomyces sp. BK022]|uniref:TOMM precursor leader peptide-binding protein n=1 Tax=Streptomyces sp. BK022 TaxID=2512123 RepID=UPI001028F4BB|nr:TOMM precursor leader peptide-binding protein [Streptomyces sp. BK022]RZU46335.1 bacteriocin biosynthesis cyclodehydratase domain-containing protein [Streptomyces sp. BK022]
MAPAPSSHEEIARSRPRIRRDVLFTRTPDGVLFHNAHGGFNVVTQSAYRFAALIVPHLDGERRVEELCAGLGDKQRDMVVRLVGALYARGFARDAGPRPTGDTLSPQVAARFAHQLDYLDHYADDAHGRFARFRDTRVAVLGDDETARWAALGLLRNGCATVAVTVEDAAEGALDHEPSGTAGLDAEVAGLTEAGCAPTLTRLAGSTPGWADLDGWDTVLVTGANAPARLLRLLTEGVPEGRRLLGAWTFGERAVVGPVMTAGTPGCWSCAALRLGAGSDAADSADLWSGLGPAAPLETPARVPTGPLAGMLGNLLSFEVFRLVTEALPAETRNQVIVQDLNSLDVLAEPLLPHPRCRFCASGEPKAPDGAALRVPHADDEPVALPADGPADEAAAKGALAALEPRDVLVREAAGVFGGYADDDWEQTPLKVSTVRLGVSPGRVREVSAIDVHHVAGARLAALFRGAEVYAEQVVPPRVGGEGSRIAPAELALSSGLQVPVDRVSAWSEATSLLDGRTVLVPTGAVRTLSGWNDQGLFERSSAGTGAAGTPRAALARALRSALAHDALRRVVRRAAPARLVDLDSLTADAELLFLLRSAENLGVTVEVLDLTGAGATALPVALARSTDPESGAVRWAPGSGLRPREAVLEALRDLLGAEQMRRAGAEPDLGDPLWADLEAAALVPEGEPVSLRADGTGWAEVLDALAAAGRDAFAVPVAAPDLAAGEIHAVRVLLTRGGPGAH